MEPSPSAAARLAALWTALRCGRGDVFLAAAQAEPALLHARDEQGNSALHWLALRGETDRLRAALAMGAPVDAAGLHAQTPLCWAVIGGHLAAVQALAAHGADVNAHDSLRATPAILAVQHGRHLVMLALIDAGADLARGDARGCAPAHWAAYKDEPTMLRMLLRRGVDLTAPDGEGLRPLHRAARGGALQAARFLVETAGVDPCALVVVPPAAVLAPPAAPSAAQPAPQPLDASHAADEGTGEPRGDAGPAPLAGGSSSSSSSVFASGVRSRSLIGGAPAAAAAGVDRRTDATRAIFAHPATGGKRALSAAAGGTTPGAAGAAAGGGGASGGGSSGASPRLVTAPGGKPAPPPPAAAAAALQNAVTVAEDTLRIMVSSARASGTYAGPENRALIARQAGVIAYLRAAAERRSGTEDGLPGAPRVTARPGSSAYARLAQCAAAVAGAPLLADRRMQARVWLPGAYVAAWAASGYVWAAHLAGLARSLAGPEWVALTACAALAWLALASVLYRTDAGALDPYGALGPDAWCSVSLASALRAAAGGGAGGAFPLQQALPAAGGTAAAADIEEASPLMPPHASRQAAAAAAAAPTGRLLADVAATTASCTLALGDIASFPLVAGSPEHTQQGVVNALNPSAYAASRVCFACELVTPLRAEHCALTGRCYERFELVSSRLGVPVARRNLALYAVVTACEAAVAVACVCAWWRYLGAAFAPHVETLALLPASHAAPVLLSADVAADGAELLPGGGGAPAPPLAARLSLLLRSSWTLWLFAAWTSYVAVAALGWLAALLRNAAANVTAFERGAYLQPGMPALLSGDFAPAAHLHFVSVAAAASAAAATAAPAAAAGPGPGVELVPVRVNPFDTGSGWRNALDAFGLLLPPLEAGGGDVASEAAAAGAPSSSSSSLQSPPPGAPPAASSRAQFAAVFARHAEEIDRVADILTKRLAAAAAAAAAAPPPALDDGGGAMPAACDGDHHDGDAAHGHSHSHAARGGVAAAAAARPRAAAMPPPANLAAMARMRALMLRTSLSVNAKAWAAFEVRHLQQRAAANPSLGASLWGRLRGAGGGHGHSHGSGPPARGRPAGDGGGSHGHSHGGGQECRHNHGGGSGGGGGGGGGGGEDHHHGGHAQ